MAGTDPLAHVETTAARVKEVRAQHAALMAEMRDAVRAADAEYGRNEIVRAADGGLSRREVYKVLGAADLLADAKNAIGRDGSHWIAFERTAGVVQFSANSAHGYGPEDFRDGTVERAARKVLQQLRSAGIEAGGVDPAARLAKYGEVELRRAKS